jgi:hypothetical protein
MTGLTWAPATLLVCLVCGCGQVRDETGTSSTSGGAARGFGAAAGAIEGGVGGRGGSGAGRGASDLGAGWASPDAGSLPPALLAQPTVWVGQVASTFTYSPSAEAYHYVANRQTPQRLVLILAPVAHGIVSGTITFGDGPAPAPPTNRDAPYPPDLASLADGGAGSSYWETWLSVPYDGFSYTLVSSTSYGARLALDFVPGELFRDWCALIHPSVLLPAITGTTSQGQCDCSASPCRSVQAPTRRVDLLVSGDSMQGQLGDDSRGSLAMPRDIRLERVQ